MTTNHLTRVIYAPDKRSSKPKLDIPKHEALVTHMALEIERRRSPDVDREVQQGYVNANCLV